METRGWQVSPGLSGLGVDDSTLWEGNVHAAAAPPASSPGVGMLGSGPYSCDLDLGCGCGRNLKASHTSQGGSCPGELQRFLHLLLKRLLHGGLGGCGDRTQSEGGQQGRWREAARSERGRGMLHGSWFVFRERLFSMVPCLISK